MYPAYFGLNEAPFSITPDPHYLFLSQRHREALAHLVYGAGVHGGFVQLTGEVGTGKTTICRAFLEQLPDHVDVALILNPTLDVSELLHVICQEFEIPIPSGPITNKELVDLLNLYLLDAHARGRRPVLMIDEAQGLSPEVLEQIRLLTNLETPKHKLLQIFLVGQPELRDLLQQKGLRQVAQRVTARYHLLPLDQKETEEYIGHRLAVAGANHSLFNRATTKLIHRYSDGIPRLINILCDRALLGAYATRQQQVNKRVVIKAARELMSPPQEKTAGRYRLPLQMTALALLSVIGIGLVATAWRGPTVTTAETPQRLVDKTSGILAIDPAAPSAGMPQARDQAAEAASAQQGGTGTIRPVDTERQGTDLATAMILLLARWDIEVPSPPPVDFCAFANSRGLYCLEGKGTLENLGRYNRPAMLEIKPKQGRPSYLIVIGLDDAGVTLDLGSTQRQVPLTEMDPAVTGKFTLLWKPPADNMRIIGDGASPESVLWLRQTLSLVPGFSVSDQTNPEYDPTLKAEVIRFQRSRELVTDGIVGPKTLIHLNNAIEIPGIPKLAEIADHVVYP